MPDFSGKYRSLRYLYQKNSYKLAGVKGIEPLSTVLETAVLPLNQTPEILKPLKKRAVQDQSLST